MKYRLRISLVLTMAVVAVAAVMPALASASSIVFVKANNVWLANADGSGQYQVTLDGSASSPYRSPSQADDGTIFAIKGNGQSSMFHKMKQNGQLLAAPFEHSAPGTGPLEATISPDGSLAVYSFLTITDYSCYPYRCGSIDGRAFYTHSDRFTPSDEIYGPQTYGDDPSWINNTRTVFANGSSTLWTDGLGAEEARQWFDDYSTPGTTYGAEGQSYRDAEVAGQTVALIRQNEGHIDDTYPADGTTSIQLYSFSGTAYSGSDGVTATCFIRKVGTPPAMEDPTLSPDASQVAWQEPDGIWSAPTACVDGKILRRIIDGGSEPDWGPANVNPGPRSEPVCTGSDCDGADDGAAPQFSANVATPPLRRALKRGLRVTVKANMRCGIGVLLLYRGKIVGKGSGSLASAGKTVVTAKFKRAARRKFRTKRKLRLKVVIGVRNAAGQYAQASGRVVLKR